PTHHGAGAYLDDKMDSSSASTGRRTPPLIEQARSALANWGWFAPERAVVAAFAPARLDVMGGIADYSGAVVLEMPLGCGVAAFAQSTDDGLLAVRTGGPALPTLATSSVTVPLTLLDTHAPEHASSQLCAALEAQEATWAAYVLGPVA